ncbi:hypothetical protein BC629DRAFT_1247609, partial [Irpex lacteus]
AKALHHLKSGGNILAVGRDASPQSIYNNPSLFPGLFPWLFPYGFGGFDNSRITKTIPLATHVQSLLMYGDKRFQVDPYFPFIAFNQDQIRQSSVGGYLLTKRRNFNDVVDRIHNVDLEALS